MTKRDLNIYVAIVLSSIILFFGALGYFTHFVNANNEIIKIKNYLSNEQSMSKDQGRDGDVVYRYKYKIDINNIDLQKTNTDLYQMIFFRLSANSYRVFLNNQLIDTVGDTERNKSNIWNSVNVVQFRKDQLKEKDNEIILELNAQWKVIKPVFPMLITNKQVSIQIHTFADVIYLGYYTAIIGISLFSALLFLKLYNESEDIQNKKNYKYQHLANVFISIYLLQYLDLPYIPFSYLTFIKLTMVSLYIGIHIVSITLARKYNMKIILITSCIPLLIILIASITTKTMAGFNSIYGQTFILLVINVLTWLYASAKHIKESYEDKIIFIATLQLIFFSIGDTYSNFVRQEPVLRLGVYGIVCFMTAFIFISMGNYIKHIKETYHQSIDYRRQKEEYWDLAIKDSLTGLYNHRYLHDYIKELEATDLRNVYMILGDIDDFKLLNDTHGHKQGDLVLKEVAQIIREVVGNEGISFRYGGEEFVIVLTNSTNKKAFDLSEMIRRKILESPAIHNISESNISISLGISSFSEDTNILLDVFDKADKAMFYSKQNGKNKTSIYDEKVEKYFLETKGMKGNKLLIDYIQGFIATLEAKDSYTAQHSKEVTRYALMLADAIGMNSTQKYELRIGALLHDCGKIGISDNVLNKKDKLTDEEYEIMKKHPTIGSYIIKKVIDNNKGIEACIKHHHERWDGKGYPDGLEKEEIHIYARIISIADAYDAMITDRPYRKAMTTSHAINELIKNKGTQFDGKLVDEFVNTISSYIYSNIS